MSNSQYTPEETEAAQTVGNPPEQPVTPEPEATEPEYFEWQGKQFPKEDVMGVVENWDNWEKAQAAITQRNMADAEKRREVEAREAELERRLAALESRRDNAPDDTQEDIDEVTMLTNKITTIERMLMEERQARETAQQELAREDEFTRALEPYQNKLGTNPEEMREFMEREGLGPDKAHIAYRALAGYHLGATTAAKSRTDRTEAPVLGSTGYGPSTGFTTHSEVPQYGDDSASLTDDQLVQRALNDPNIG